MPTRIPTISPSNSPSDFALQEQILIRQDVLMIMGNTYPMDLDEQNIWLNFTTKKLKYEVEKVIELENIGISNVTIDRLDNSNIRKFRKEVKIDAIKAAKEKAESLATAIGQSTGRAIYIQELEGVAPNVSNRIIIRGASSISNSSSVDVGVAKL